MKKKLVFVISILLSTIILTSFFLTSCTIDTKASILNNKSILKIKTEEDIKKLKDPLIDDIDPLSSAIIRDFNNEKEEKITIYQRVSLDAQQRKDINFNKILEKFKNNPQVGKYKDNILSPIVNIIVLKRLSNDKFSVNGFIVDSITKDLGNNKFQLELKYYKLKEKTVEQDKINSFIEVLNNHKLSKNKRHGLTEIIKLEDFVENIKLKDEKNIGYKGDIAEDTYLKEITLLLNDLFENRNNIVNLLPAMSKEILPDNQNYKLEKINNKEIEYKKTIDSKNYQLKYTFTKKTNSFTLNYKDNKNNEYKKSVDYINGVEFGFYQLTEDAIKRLNKK